MAGWYNKVSDNLSNIIDCIDYYEAELAEAKKECYIKGNISSKGQKIYHIPGNLNYEKTKINKNKGERWFCSEEEAKMNGWRKSKK